jgi:hypothetical protein
MFLPFPAGGMRRWDQEMAGQSPDREAEDVMRCRCLADEFLIFIPVARNPRLG